jgi:hypothetical protein
MVSPRSIRAMGGDGDGARRQVLSPEVRARGGFWKKKTNAYGSVEKDDT